MWSQYDLAKYLELVIGWLRYSSGIYHKAGDNSTLWFEDWMKGSKGATQFKGIEEEENENMTTNFDMKQYSRIFDIEIILEHIEVGIC
jgi:hypothetical protein